MTNDRPTVLTTRRKIALGSAVILVAGFCIPQQLSIPVEGANASSYNAESFWYYPWGRSVTHKGVDLFAKAGTPVLAATGGVVLYCGQLKMGGNVVLVLGPKWRVHYYAHLQEVSTNPWTIVGRGATIGKVGSTGNAVGKPPHLHYSIATLVPYPWRIDADRQGWKKAFYLNPITFF